MAGSNLTGETEASNTEHDVDKTTGFQNKTGNTRERARDKRGRETERVRERGQEGVRDRESERERARQRDPREGERVRDERARETRHTASTTITTKHDLKKHEGKQWVSSRGNTTVT